MGNYFKIGCSPKHVANCRKLTKSQVNAMKAEFNEFVHYYKNNAKSGWQMGKRLSDIKKYPATKSHLLKIYAACLKTKVRIKDLPPAILGAAGAITPIPGASIVGFSIGTIIPKIFKAILRKK